MMRTITSIMGNSQRLDGGAMFGNAPKPLWQRWAKPDAQNRIPLACRAMLVRDGGRNILFETGIGAFFEPRLRERYGGVEEGHVLLESLAAEGLTHEDIHIVVLSHLHFDHAGGMLSAYEEGRAPELLFPNAQVLVSTAAWERCQRPHARDRRHNRYRFRPLGRRGGRTTGTASSETRNAVPHQPATAPVAMTPANARPLAMPPAAITGVGATASMTWGSRASVPMRPVWPPASVPWATT